MGSLGTPAPLAIESVFLSGLNLPTGSVITSSHSSCITAYRSVSFALRFQVSGEDARLGSLNARLQGYMDLLLLSVAVIDPCMRHVSLRPSRPGWPRGFVTKKQSGRVIDYKHECYTCRLARRGRGYACRCRGKRLLAAAALGLHVNATVASIPRDELYHNTTHSLYIHTSSRLPKKMRSQ